VPNKATAELRQYAGQYSTEAIDGLVSIARTSESDQAKVGAWREVLDRAHGKAPQAVTGEDGKPLFPLNGITINIPKLDGADNRT
jgi:hypothetical protein